MDNMSLHSPESGHQHSWPWMNTSLSPDERVTLLLAQMTLEEKVGMVHGKSNDTYSTRDLLITCFTPMGSPNWHTLSVQTG